MKNRKFYARLWILFVFLPLLLQSQPTLEGLLYDLPDVRFEAIETPEGFTSAYELRIKQPLDHNDPSQGHFYQRVFLTHAGFDRPNVIITEGYTRGSNRMYELTTLLNANQMDVEHRFFGVSRPDSLDYRFLTLEQVTADLHRVRTLLGQIYREDWVATGISKGGQTTIHYRYFYPDDVEVSVPYVAPHNLSLEDTRIYDFLAKVGPEDCRKAIYDFQVRILRDRDAVLPRLKWYSKGAGEEFTYLTLEAAFEYAVLEYPFSFWQLGHDCNSIPPETAPVDEALEHFIEVVGLSLFSDQSMTDYGSHYYQAATQMGYYGYLTEPFADYLKVLSGHPSAIFPPDKMQTTFDPALVKRVYDWTQTEADRFIYIYGANDTWTATAVPPSDKVDALWIFMEGRDHGSARIRNMQPEEREQVMEALHHWLAED